MPGAWEPTENGWFVSVWRKGVLGQGQFGLWPRDTLKGGQVESEAVTHTQRESHRNKCRRIVETVQSSGALLGPAYIVASLFSPASRLQFSLIPCPCLQSDTQEGGREGDWLHWGHVSALVQLAKAGEQGHRLLWALGKLEF